MAAGCSRGGWSDGELRLLSHGSLRRDVVTHALLEFCSSLDLNWIYPQACAAALAVVALSAEDLSRGDLSHGDGSPQSVLALTSNSVPDLDAPGGTRAYFGDDGGDRRAQLQAEQRLAVQQRQLQLAQTAGPTTMLGDAPADENSDAAPATGAGPEATPAEPNEAAVAAQGEPAHPWAGKLGKCRLA